MTRDPMIRKLEALTEQMAFLELEVDHLRAQLRERERELVRLQQLRVEVEREIEITKAHHEVRKQCEEK
jgi:hypothetical protein